MITKQEITAYRFCHHDFGGLPTAEAASHMGVSQRRVQQLLKSLEQKAPQLFPILTKQQAKDYHYYTVEGWTVKEIAEHTHRTTNAICKSIERAVERGMPRPGKRGSALRYEPFMDNRVKERF